MFDDSMRIPLPDPLQYVPPFVSQRPPDRKRAKDESIDDCTWAAGVMLVAAWTLGEVVTSQRWRRVRKYGLFERRHRLRLASGDTGASNLTDLARGVRRFWPHLEALEPHISVGAGGKLALDVDELWMALRKGHCAIIQGNPKATAGDSAFRTAQTQDDYAHAVYVHAVQGRKARMMDPLKPWGSYRGAAVTRGQIKDFMAAYDPPCFLLVARGGQSPEERAKADRRKLGERLKTTRRELRQLKKDGAESERAGP